MPASIATAAVGAYSANRTNKAAKDAANASIQGSQLSADAQMQALEYLKSRDALGNNLSDYAKQQLANYYSVPGQPTDYNTQLQNARSNPLYALRPQSEQIQDAINSPLYGAIMGTKQDALDAVARYGSATGQLRSGNTVAGLAREGQRVANEALLQSFNAIQQRDMYNNQGVVDTFGQLQGQENYLRGLNLSGLTGLAGFQGNDQAIAGLTAGAGDTLGRGMVAAAQARQQGTQNNINTGLGLLGLGVMGYGNGLIKI